MALEPWRSGRVLRIEQQTETTRRFFIESSDLKQFNFKPGQFVTLDLPIHEKLNKRLRSYSIASCPDGTNVFELCIVFMQGGAGTDYLFNHVKAGDVLTYRGPVGVFTLPEMLENDIYMICTGTGIAPFRSMLRHIHLQNIPHKSLHLIFGTRNKQSLLYYDEMIALEKSLEDFHYYPILSRETWEGKKGYVHAVYEELLHTNKSSISDSVVDPIFYLCGWREMIDEAKQRITNLGFDKRRIHQELYG